MRLGHCICEPRRPCPCEVFRDHGLCPCAGERPDPVNLADVKLTRLVRNAGCASKIAPADLEAFLTRLPPVHDPAVLSGLAAADDAAIYRLTDSLCLVQTVDVFTPCVDDPRQFGRICAANCLSDVYAMGGEPRTALSILAFPAETMPGEVMYHMLAGAMETLGQAGVALIGGHSLKDDEIKLGFAITGVIDPAVARRLDQPAVGDWLVLTKPLGTGVLAFAEQVGRGHAAGFAAAAESMATLNRAAAEAMRAAGVSACTDITGFGLFGHLIRMLRQHGLTARILADALPAFDGVLDALRTDVIPGALERNREFVGADLELEPGADPARVNLGFDAQTSGGLLLAMPAAGLGRLQRELAVRGCRGFVIGELIGSSCGRIVVTAGSANDPPANPGAGEGNSGQSTPWPRVEPSLPEPTLRDGARLPPSRADVHSTKAREDARPTGFMTMATGDEVSRITQESNMEPNPVSEAHATGCCAEAFTAAVPPASLAQVQRAFGELMRAVQAAGALDVKTKELILFSLVVYSRCQPCFKAHHARALELGLTQAQLDEAAWCAITMGGAPVKVFYQEALETR